MVFVLRDYLYVDVDKVYGLASQIWDRVPEKETTASGKRKGGKLSLKVAELSGEVSDQGAIESNLRDSLFERLEADLEAEGLLTDASDTLSAEGPWESICGRFRPGRIVRVTADGTLFHPAQLSEALVGLANAASGMADLAGGEKTQAGKTKRPPGAPSKGRSVVPGSLPTDEDRLPPDTTIPLLDLPRTQLAGMIRAVQGVYKDGVHVHLRPAGKDGPVISARLDPGRRFLDSSPDVLLSRYGLIPQEWTLVGLIGAIADPAYEQLDQVRMDDGFRRDLLIDVIGSLLHAGGGFIDVPTAPGFTIVPLALYRCAGLVEPHTG